MQGVRGAVEHLRIARVRNLADFLADAKRTGSGATAPTLPACPTSPRLRGGVVLVMGAEGSGLGPRVAKACDELIALPMRGRWSR